MRKILFSLVPKPNPFQLIRIGGGFDGAYLIPDDLTGIEACFSPGVDNFKKFEDELAIKYGIKSHMCDYSSDVNSFRTPLLKNWQTFRKKWLDIPGTVNGITLEEWVNSESPDPDKDLMLQMDIEGAEYRTLTSTGHETIARFRIIALELHGLNAIGSKDETYIQINRLFKKLEQTHTCIHAHPNNCEGEHIDQETGMNIPDVLEITLLRNDRFNKPCTRMIQPQLPHPLDIPFNVLQNNPLHLNLKWGSYKSSNIKRYAKISKDYAFQAIVKTIIWLRNKTTIFKQRHRVAGK